MGDATFSGVGLGGWPIVCFLCWQFRVGVFCRFFEVSLVGVLTIFIVPGI